MTLQVGIWGGREGGAWLWADAFRAAGAGLPGLGAPDAARGAERAKRQKLRAYGRIEDVVADASADAVAFLEPVPAEALQAALAAGKHLFLAHGVLRSEADAHGVCAAASRADRALLALEPWLHFPPAVEARRLLREHVVGRPSSVRMRSLLAGRGGWDADLNPRFVPAEPETPPSLDEAFAGEVAAKLSLATWMFGDIAEVRCFSGPGAAIVTWRHELPAMYGALEVCAAPGLSLRSAWDAREDVLEATGSAGIVWLTRGAAQLRSEPALRMYRADRTASFEHVDADWGAAVRRCAAEAVRAVADARARRAAREGLPRLAALVDAAARGRAGGERSTEPARAAG